mgnify:CR=1 FL=1
MLLDYLKLMTFTLKKYKWLFLAFFILINFIMLPLCLSEIFYSNVLQSDPQMLCFNFLQKNILLIYIIIQSFMFRFYVEKDFNEIIYVFLTIFLYLLKCPQSLILSALRAFCFCGKPHISRSIFLYFRYQAWLKSW